MNLPNKITVARMFIAPIFLAVYLANLPHRFFLSALFFAIGAVTDAFDGKIARKNNIVTNFGKFLDPIADKMLVTACLLCFMKDGLCNIWLVMIMLSREFAVTSMRLIASAQGVVIPANIFGKVKTVLQMVLSIIIMLLCEANEVFNFEVNINIISNVLMAVAALASIVSGAIYIINGSKLID